MNLFRPITCILSPNFCQKKGRGALFSKEGGCCVMTTQNILNSSHLIFSSFNVNTLAQERNLPSQHQHLSYLNLILLSLYSGTLLTTVKTIEVTPSFDYPSAPTLFIIHHLNVQLPSCPNVNNLRPHPLVSFSQ